MNASPFTRWQILDVGSIWMKEFSHALSKVEDVVAWAPRMDMLGMFHNGEELEVLADPSLTMYRFPLQRGYARWPLRSLAPFEHRILERMRRRTEDPERSPLVCSTPFYAPVAERWPGPLIYYVTDLTVAYDGMDPKQVLSLDRRMCAVARLVCPNSRRIANYLISEVGCDPEKIEVVPNATREANVSNAPRLGPAALPNDVKSMPRPIVGVLGDLSGNMDWVLIAEAIRRTPRMNWIFVGPTTRAIRDAKQRAARSWAQRNARFVGMKPYAQLQSYARCVDVAVLPYIRKEPTFSGSSTRFYEHLAAGRPMIATRGFAELVEKEPLVRLVDTVDEMVAELELLQARGFGDGHEADRWEASKLGTWEERARAMREALRWRTESAVATVG